MTDAKKIGLDLLREPFQENQISKLPKPTQKQTEQVKADYTVGIRCGLCGAWHHKDVIHLDYVGHAALTDRLLDCDNQWNWEPLAFDPLGQPLIKDGGMWIKLTVCGVTRLGFGDEGYGADRIQITAIGEQRFLCRWDYKCKGVFNEESGCTSLEAREWKKVS